MRLVRWVPPHSANHDTKLTATQIPEMPGNWGLIDIETPREVYTKPGYLDPSQEMQLVFSDEFNTDGRSFYPGDDPYWEAVDLHYWQVSIAIFWSKELSRP